MMSGTALGPSFSDRLTGLARQIADNNDFTIGGASIDILQLVMAVAPQVQWATFTRQRRAQDEPRTTAFSEQTGLDLDRFQYEAHQGPCLEALASEVPVMADDLGTDVRWPGFTSLAVERTPARAVFSYPLARSGTPDYSLNLYAEQLGAFSFEDPALLMAVSAAGFAMSAIALRQRADNLATAMISNREIGTAIGILMAKYSWTSEQAFDAIRRRSQQEHRKVREIARDVAAAGGFTDDEERPES